MKYIITILLSVTYLLARSADYPFMMLPRYDDFSTFDPLYTDYETKFFKRSAKSISINLGMNYSWATQWYDQEGTKIDSTYAYGMNKDRAKYCSADYATYTIYGEAVYCPTDAWKIGAIIPMVYKTVTPQSALDTSAFSLGDTWFYASALMMPDPSILLRIGIKAPVGSWKDYYREKDWHNESEIERDANPPLGSGQWDFDFGFLACAALQRHRSGIDPLVLDFAGGMRLRARKTFDDYTWTNSYTDTLMSYRGVRDSIVEYKFEETLYDLRPGNEFHFSVGPRALLTPKLWSAVKITGFFSFNDRINGVKRRYENKTLISEDKIQNLDLDGSKAIYIEPSIDFEMGVGLYLKAAFKYPLFSGRNYPSDNQLLGIALTRKFGPAPYSGKYK